MLVDQFQESLKVTLPLMLSSKKQPLLGAQAHRTENDTTSVLARNEHTGRFDASTPVGVQRREEKQIGFVFHQQFTARRQVPNSAEDSSFCARARDAAPTRIGVASIRSPVGSAHVV